jgi:hypothetical protein
LQGDEFPAMPQSALRHVNVDYTVPSSEIGPLLRAMMTSADPLGPPET